MVVPPLRHDVNLARQRSNLVMERWRQLLAIFGWLAVDGTGMVKGLGRLVAPRYSSGVATSSQP